MFGCFQEFFDGALYLAVAFGKWCVASEEALVAVVVVEDGACVVFDERGAADAVVTGI